MKKVQIEFDELPFPTLERFGLTREMIEDLPMRVLDDICDGRHSPVLPVRVTDEHGGQIESRSRFAFIRMDNGEGFSYTPGNRKTVEKVLDNVQMVGEVTYLFIDIKGLAK